MSACSEIASDERESRNPMIGIVGCCARAAAGHAAAAPPSLMNSRRPMKAVTFPPAGRLWPNDSTVDPHRAVSFGPSRRGLPGYLGHMLPRRRNLLAGFIPPCLPA